ncbi:MAG: MBL fold metallo-hydrolase [Pseudomonadota bacterium]
MDGAEGTSAPLSYPFDAPPPEGEATEVAEGVLWMRLPLPMALNHVNVYALDDGDGWTLVDSGFASRRSRAIWDRLLAGPLSGKPVRRLVVTHHHPDHIGLAGWFQSAHGAELLITRTAWLFARMLTLDVQDRPAAETAEFWRAAGMAPEILAQRLTERPFNFADSVAPLPLGFHKIAEGDTLSIGGRTWDVRLGSGHAPDHATLWAHADPLVIGGDQLLPSISPNLGVYATEPDADPVSDWLQSCHRLSAFARDDQLVLPGHKLPFTGLPARLRQLADNHHGALARLRDWLRVAPRTAHECFQPLFRREIGSAEYGLALVEAVAHLNHLHQAGEARRSLREDGAWLYRMTQV